MTLGAKSTAVNKKVVFSNPSNGDKVEAASLFYQYWNRAKISGALKVQLCTGPIHSAKPGGNNYVKMAQSLIGWLIKENIELLKRENQSECESVEGLGN